jgi:hypothetical protein
VKLIANHPPWHLPITIMRVLNFFVFCCLRRIAEAAKNCIPPVHAASSR